MITRSEFGQDKNGAKVFAYTVENKNGMKLKVSDLGATLVELWVADRDGTLEDVILGYDSAEGYLSHGGYLGAVIGRSGNRIANGTFLLNGKQIQMPQNEAANSLHSGPDGYDQRIWNTEVVEEKNAIVFTLESPDGDQGLPGTFKTSVTYTLTDANEVQLEYQGISDQDTIANMTNHTYFNLSGKADTTILDHELMIDADGITEVKEGSIPTGKIRPVENTVFDFRKAKRIGLGIDAKDDQILLGGGYDHNFALNHKAGTFDKIAEVYEPISGRKMSVWTDLPGVQFYAGNFIDEGSTGKQGRIHRKRYGLCLETQYYPDAMNHESFLKPVLPAGKEYHTVTKYCFEA